MKTSRGGWIGLAVLVGLLIAGGAGSLHAATFTWSAAGGGSWNTAGNWSVVGSDADGVPDADDDVTLGNTTADRVITVDATTATADGSQAVAGYKTLTINQTTAGVTNQLALNVAMGGFLDTTYPSFTGGGAILLNLKGKQWQTRQSGSGATTFTLPSNVTLLAGSGGKLTGRYYEDPKMNLVIQGQAAWSGGAGGTANNATTTVDSGATLTVTNNGQYIAGATIAFGDNGAKLISKGTLTGDATGAIYARTLQLDPGSTVVSGLGTLTTANFDLRTINPATVNLSATTLQNINAGGTSQTMEVGANATGSYLINKLRINGGNTRVALVDNYDNDLSSAAPEHLEVNTLQLAPNNVKELDLNGKNVTVNTSLTLASPTYQNLISNRGAGSTSTLTLPAVNLNCNTDANSGLGFAVKNNATLAIVGPTSISNINIEPSTGTISLSTNATGRITLNNLTWTTGNALIIQMNGNQFNISGGSLNAPAGVSITVQGNVRNYYSAGGLLAGALTKTGASGPPTTTAGGVLVINGNYLADAGGDNNATALGSLGRGSTFKLGGNFDVMPMWNPPSPVWTVDSSSLPNTFVFNGGGAVQTFETMSNPSSTITTTLGLDYFAASATPVVSTTVTGGSSGASATVSAVSGGRLTLTGLTGNFLADETLTFSDSKTARAYGVQFAALNLGANDGNDNRFPLGTVIIGESGGSIANVKLVNNRRISFYGGDALSKSSAQLARSLTVTSGSTFDLASLKMVVAIGTNSTVAGLITNSVAGGTLILANGAALRFQNGGVIDVDTLTIGAGCKVDFNQAVGSYFRVNGNQKAAFDALIVGAQIVDNGGGMVKAAYSAGDAHTTVYLAPPPAGTLILLK